MIWKVIAFIILLIAVPFVDGLGSGEQEAEFPTSGGSLTADNFGSGGQIGGPTSVRLDLVPDGELTAPAVVSRKDNGISFSKGDYLKVRNDAQVNDGRDVVVVDDGSVSSSFTGHFSYHGFSASNIVNLDFDAASETVSDFGAMSSGVASFESVSISG